MLAVGGGDSELLGGMVSTALPRPSPAPAPQQKTPKTPQKTPRSTSKSARRQFRETVREVEAGQSSSSDCASLPRPGRAKQRLLPAPVRPGPAPPRTSSPAAVQQDGIFRNVDQFGGDSSGSRPDTLPSLSGRAAPQSTGGTLRSEGSVSIDSLSGSSSYSQKIAFSETNMQSSLGYLP